MPHKSRKTYTRDDGVVMVEISPGVWVSKDYAERQGLLRPATGGIVGPGKPYLVGEHASDYPVSRALAERMGILR
ncbi:hypothetical protein [Microvirga sp. Mcv34]|uniref:hypothetical protein n=1 Tax=Microvirga sp. Mcv34 TaxID=2926016 RepID=UPI0021C7BE5D|nr:hypothetical protein [Microvirga sp. Mcv34]